jgi:dTDP-4-amino-4,6-dideoxygalactose transaminase
MLNIPLSYTPINIDKLSHVLRRYEGESHTKIVTDFEETVSRITGAKYVVALNSGTAAIHLGLLAIGVKEGDEVIVSTFTFVAAATPILHIGAKPVFIDSERDTWNMDPDLLEQAIKNRLEAGVKPKAIVVVHSYGMPAKLREIKVIADRYGIILFEDAAEALGSSYFGRQPGTFGEAGVLSFNNNKIVTTYGGGAIITNNETVYRRTLFLAEQAREPKLYYEYREAGYNYRMGSLNAAAGLAQIDDLDMLVIKRREVHELYRAQLEKESMEFIVEPANYRSNRWLTVIALKREKKAITILDALKKEGIEARFLWNPMHKQPVFSEFKAFLTGISEDLFSRGVSLPSSPNLSYEDIKKIVKLLVKEVKT